VNAALEFQRQMTMQNVGIDEAGRLEFRIGINVGEVIHDRSDIYGDGVNIAARIQELAERGGVCISRMAYEQIAGKVDQKFDDLGHRKLKNVAHPVHVYRARLSNIPMGVEGQPYFEFDGKPVDRGTLITGGCLCGEVRYEIDQPALGTGFCHCRVCQKFSGAPVTAFTVFATKAVRFVKSEPNYYKSSLIYERGFCTNCGSSLTGRYYAPEPPDWIGIKTTSLDTPEDFAPTWHLGMESQLPWLEIEDDLPRVRCEESPDLLRRWEALGISRPADWKFFTG